MKVLFYHLPVLFLGIILMILAVVTVDTAYLTIEMSGTKDNFIQVFWTGEDGKYLPEKSATYATKPGRRKYTFALTDALFIHQVRVDLQNGRKGRTPRPIELHSIQVEFKGLYHRMDFDLSLSDMNTVQDIVVQRSEGDSEKIIFSSSDPYIIFDLSIRPKYYQLILPVLLLLLLHWLLVSYFLGNRKESWLLDMVVPDGALQSPGLPKVLQGKTLSTRLVMDKQHNDRRRVQLVISGCDLGFLRSTLQQSGLDIRSLQIASLNGGEAVWRRFAGKRLSPGEE